MTHVYHCSIKQNGASQLTLVVKNLPVNAEDMGLIPALGRPPGEGNRNPFQYSRLENSMVCIDHGVAESRPRLSDFPFTSLRVLQRLGSHDGSFPEGMD